MHRKTDNFQIRQKFHNQIRRQQRNQYFKHKRSILLSSLQQQWQVNIKKQQRSLSQIFSLIKAGNNRQRAIVELVNTLATQQPFKLLFNNKSDNKSPCSDKQISQFCQQLVSMLFNETLLCFQQNHQRQDRQNCITAIANLFVEPKCQNVSYVKIVVHSIDRFYGGLDFWGLDQEIIEVYYMLANLMGKKIVQANILQLQLLLDWCEHGVKQIPTHCLNALLKGCLKFFNDVDQLYNKSHDVHNSACLSTQHFKQSRCNIIEAVIIRFINQHSQSKQCLDSSSLITIFTFLSKQKYYLLQILNEFKQNQKESRINNFFKKIIILFNRQCFNRKFIKILAQFLIQLLNFCQSEQKEQQQNGNNKKALIQKNSKILIGQNNNRFILQIMHNNKNEQTRLFNSKVGQLHTILLSSHISDLLKTLCLQDIQIKLIILKIISHLLFHMPQTLNIVEFQLLIEAYDYLFGQKQIEMVLISSVDGSRKLQRDIIKQILSIYFIVVKFTKGMLLLKLKSKLQSILQAIDIQNDQQLYLLIQEHIKFHIAQIKQTNSKCDQQFLI